MLFGVKPSYEHVRDFGSSCYAHNHSRTRDMYDAQAHKCIFLCIHIIRKGGRFMILRLKGYMYLEMWFSMRMFFHGEVARCFSTSLTRTPSFL